MEVVLYFFMYIHVLCMIKRLALPARSKLFAPLQFRNPQKRSKKQFVDVRIAAMLSWHETLAGVCPFPWSTSPSFSLPH